MNYLELLERSHKLEIKYDICCRPDEPMSKLEYLNYVFDFTTYADFLDEIFVTKALEVCKAISNKSTFDYIHKSDDHHLWFIAMCNMPFFISKISWGTSIRGAWWDIYEGADKPFIIKSTGLYDENEEQILALELNAVEWGKFIAAMLEFAEIA